MIREGFIIRDILENIGIKRSRVKLSYDGNLSTGIYNIGFIMDCRNKKEREEYAKIINDNADIINDLRIIIYHTDNGVLTIIGYLEYGNGKVINKYV